MPNISLCRAAFEPLAATATEPHIGLFLSRGLWQWPENATQKGEAFQAHVDKAAGFAAPAIYEAAYKRWCHMVADNPTIAPWAGTLQGRLFIGLGGPSVIETGISLSRTYGVPLIPGSAQKGLSRAYAAEMGLPNRTIEILFGKQGVTPDDIASGYIIFHDAWWVPGSATYPLAPEIVTVHHQKYYQDGGQSDATDFDAPIPNVQVAARGGFLFTVECADQAWAALARDLLAQALQQWGIGGKTAAGYGRFAVDESALNRILSETEKLWTNAVIKYVANTGSIELSCEGRRATPIRMSKDVIERRWPGLLNQIRRQTTCVSAAVKQSGNRIDVVSIKGVKISDNS